MTGCVNICSVTDLWGREQQKIRLVTNHGAAGRSGSLDARAHCLEGPGPNPGQHISEGSRRDGEGVVGCCVGVSTLWVQTCGLFSRGRFRQHCLYLRPASSQMPRSEPKMECFLNLTAGQLPAGMGALEKQEQVCVWSSLRPV